MSSQTVHHGVNWNLKHITVITCVAASGEHAISYIITSQESDHLREVLRKKGIEFGRPLILMENQKPYVHSKSFDEYIKLTFISHVTRMRSARGIEQEDTVLLMDNYPSHLTRDVKDLLNTARVRVVTFAPHARKIFQLLDLTSFGMFKREGKYHLPFSDLGTTVNFVYNISLKMAKTLSPQTYGQHFRQLKSRLTRTVSPTVLSFRKKS
jgi:hypothetical protein